MIHSCLGIDPPPLNDAPFSRRQVALETIISYMRKEIREIARRILTPISLFSGTLFLFLSVSSILGIVPGYRSPTSSLHHGGPGRLRLLCGPDLRDLAAGPSGYFQAVCPADAADAPFNVIGEISRTVALALRLFGNMMSQTLLVAVLISLAPLFLPGQWTSSGC